MMFTAMISVLSLAALAQGERITMEPDVTTFGGRNWNPVRRTGDSDEVRLHFYLKHSKYAPNNINVVSYKSLISLFL
ncbi:MAG: hypothetical protein AAGM67_22165 [Bacteroidota bacterium]